jgi:RNA polymerase sigma factor (sigma-70 family)
MALCNSPVQQPSKPRMKYQDDNFYIERVLSGDVSAYATLVTKHKSLVFSIALKILNNREDAEEVAQDCFLKAFQSLKYFEKKSKFSTWLYRIAYNASVSRTRKKRLEFVPMDNYVIQNYSENYSPKTIMGLEEHEQILLIDRALQRLSADERLLISLFYKGENSIEEISYITGLTISNVKVRLHRIRKKLYGEISEIMFQRVI